MTTDPTSHQGPQQASIALRAHVLNLDDQELTASSSLALDLAATVDRRGQPRVRTFWTAVALLLQAELVRREAIYASAIDDRSGDE